MEESTREMKRRTGEETEVVNYADHHHGMCGEELRCAGIKVKSERRMLKLRGGTAPLQVEMGNGGE